MRLRKHINCLSPSFDGGWENHSWYRLWAQGRCCNCNRMIRKSVCEFHNIRLGMGIYCFHQYWLDLFRYWLGMKHNLPDQCKYSITLGICRMFAGSFLLHHSIRGYKSMFRLGFFRRSCCKLDRNLPQCKLNRCNHMRHMQSENRHRSIQHRKHK